MAEEPRQQTGASVDAPDEKRSRRHGRMGGRARREAGEHSALGERLIAGVPARIMRPRLVFIACLAALLAFGLLMVYSASSVEALSEYGSSTFFLERQAFFIAAGLALAAVLSRIPLATMRSHLAWWAWGGIVLLLVAVLVFGRNVGGATRWVELPLIGQLQPSEFAKSVIIATAAKILHEYYEEQSIDAAVMFKMLAVCVIVPLIAIILEPDFGTCLIIAGTVFVMCYFAGFSYKLIGFVLLVGALIGAIFIFSSSYRAARVFTVSDPWADPYGDGYQATLAIMAFASGGIFGRGIGNSTMKYNYLPEAHNDYILAIIGEELGFVGVAIFFAVFALLIYAGLKIASQSPTVQGRLIASGCSVMLMIQFLVNMLGILGVTPMTGKPLPFISYGGSAMIGMLALAGLIMRVSLESNPKTVYDARRAGFRVMGEGAPEADGGDPGTIEGSTAGAARPRSARRHDGFSVVDGTGFVAPGEGARPMGRSEGRAGRRGSASRGGGAADRATRNARPSSGRTQSFERGGSYERVNLGADPADRLRSRGPQRRYDGGDDSSKRRGPHGR